MQAECMPWVGIEPPGTDLPTASERASLHGCDDEAAYYGIAQAVDYRKARLCAFTHAALSEPFLGMSVYNLPKGAVDTSRCLGCTGVIEGPAILMMIYANGKGVPRNFDLAIKFACEAGPDTDPDGEPHLTTDRAARLERLKAENWTGADFDQFDDFGNKRMAYAERAAIYVRRAEIIRGKKLRQRT